MKDTDTNSTIEVTLWGGYSFAHGEPESFGSIVEACNVYVDRYNSNGIRMVDGALWACWGDCADDEYVITVEGDGLTRADVFVIADGGEVPMGWG